MRESDLLRPPVDVHAKVHDVIHIFEEALHRVDEVAMNTEPLVCGSPQGSLARTRKVGVRVQQANDADLPMLRHVRIMKAR